MKTIIRKSVRNEITKAIPELLDSSLCWMKSKYANVNFENIEYIFSNSFNRSRYFRNANNVKYQTPTICIHTTKVIGLYDMKTLKIKKRFIIGDTKTQIMCALIHELTHHMQYELGLAKGELETTRNELDYLKQYHPSYYNKMMGIKTPPLI
jgi:hypothetical protein